MSWFENLSDAENMEEFTQALLELHEETKLRHPEENNISQDMYLPKIHDDLRKKDFTGQEKTLNNLLLNLNRVISHKTMQSEELSAELGNCQNEINKLDPIPALKKQIENMETCKRVAENEKEFKEAEQKLKKLQKEKEKKEKHQITPSEQESLKKLKERKEQLIGEIQSIENSVGIAQGVFSYLVQTRACLELNLSQDALVTEEITMSIESGAINTDWEIEVANKRLLEFRSPENQTDNETRRRDQEQLDQEQEDRNKRKLELPAKQDQIEQEIKRNFFFLDQYLQTLSRLYNALEVGKKIFQARENSSGSKKDMLKGIIGSDDDPSTDTFVGLQALIQKEMEKVHRPFEGTTPPGMIEIQDSSAKLVDKIKQGMTKLEEDHKNKNFLTRVRHWLNHTFRKNDPCTIKLLRNAASTLSIFTKRAEIKTQKIVNDQAKHKLSKVA